MPGPARPRRDPPRGTAPAPARACSIDRVLVESVPNVSEGRRLDVVERLATALTSVPGVYLLDRTSDASHNRSVFTVAASTSGTLDGARPARGAGDRGHRHERAQRRAPADRGGRRHPLHLRSGHDDDCLRRMARGVPRRAWPRAGTTSRSSSTRTLPPCRSGPARPCDAGSTRASATRSPERARARLRPADAPDVRGPGGLGPAVPHRLQHQPRLGRPRAREAHRPACPRVERRPAEGPGEPGSGSSRSSGRAQVSMNLLDFADTPMRRLRDTVRSSPQRTASSSRSRSLIGLAPLAAPCSARPTRAGAAGRRPGRSAARCRRRIPRAARLLAGAGARASPRGREHGPAGRGGPFRSSRVGARRRAAPGLLIHGAARSSPWRRLRRRPEPGRRGPLVRAGSARAARGRRRSGRRRLGGPDRGCRPAGPRSSTTLEAEA